MQLVCAADRLWAYRDASSLVYDRPDLPSRRYWKLLLVNLCLANGISLIQWVACHLSAHLAVEDVECCAGRTKNGYMSLQAIPKKCQAAMHRLDACIEQHQDKQDPGWGLRYSFFGRADHFHLWRYWNSHVEVGAGIAEKTSHACQQGSKPCVWAFAIGIALLVTRSYMHAGLRLFCKVILIAHDTLKVRVESMFEILMFLTHSMTIPASPSANMLCQWPLMNPCSLSVQN